MEFASSGDRSGLYWVLTVWRKTVGDVIRPIDVGSSARRRSLRLRIYFDAGSPRTFVKASTAQRLGGMGHLEEPETFGGLGNGSFRATHMIHLHFRLAGIWVPHFCYVLADSTLEPKYDVLLGHDFMQVYDIRLRLRTREVIVSRDALRMALRVRRA